MAEDKRVTEKAGTWGQNVFGGTTPNDLATPAWNAVEGDGLSGAPDREEPTDAFHSGRAFAQEGPEAYDPDEPVGAIDLAAVPDADEIAADSPVDPAAPPTDVVNGTDLLNGAGADDPDDDFRRVDPREDR
ncbi:hypothetical protein [Gorillibacterium sp. sgz500922]|uniref:hypothetical protein n=1 Tax=Gorillibacterium sp. sgz500922 TaxID=3446694 RepID=UPI003F66B29D